MPTHSRKTILLATDQQRSVLNALNANGPHPIAYSPYGHRPADNALLSLLGFNGERPDPLTGHYHLGNGYRQFNPVLMRFNRPDSSSPFEKGGVNAYAYCEGDPIGRYDPTGHSFLSALMSIGKHLSNIVKPTMFNASKAAAVVGIAGLVVEATVELDETANDILLFGSLFLLGAGLGGMYKLSSSSSSRLASTSNNATSGNFEMVRRNSPTRPYGSTPPFRLPRVGPRTNNFDQNQIRRA